jgi:hypothetical protein
MSTHTIAVFVVMGEDGGYEVGVDEDMALDRFEDQFTGRHRVVKLNVTMTAPDLIEADVTVPDDADDMVEAAAE